MTGTAIAQALPILLSPVISRLYDPEDIGIFAVFTGIVNILVLLVTGRYERAIVLPKEDKDGLDVSVLTICLNIVISTIFFIVIFFFEDAILLKMNTPALKGWLLFIPVFTFLFGLYQTFNYFLNRYKKFTGIAQGNVLYSVGNISLQIILSNWKSGGMIYSTVVSRFFSVVFYGFKIFKGEIIKIKYNLSWQKLKKTAKEHADFPLYALPNAVLNTFSSSMPLLFLGGYFNMTTVGHYGWANRLIQAPVSLIAASTYQVFYKEANDRYNNGEILRPFVIRVYKKLFLAAIIPYTLAFFLAPFIFTYVFGQEWTTAGEYTKYLIPWFLLVFLNTPATSLIYIYKKQKLMLLFESGLTACRFIALYIGYLQNSPTLSIILFGAVGFLYNLMLMFFLIRFSSTPAVVSK